MRVLEEVEKELIEANKELAEVEGTKTEVYSRIVGYYRSVRNWNKGKLEEYGQRKLFQLGQTFISGENPAPPGEKDFIPLSDEQTQAKLLLFVRKSCPSCPGAKIAAAKLGITLELIDADTAEGCNLALSRSVCATPTAILFDRNGMEQGRAYTADGIASLSTLIESAGMSGLIPQFHQERINATVS